MRKLISAPAAIALAMPINLGLPAAISPATAQSFPCSFHPEIGGYTFYCTDSFDSRAECEAEIRALRDYYVPDGRGGLFGRMNQYMPTIVITNCEKQSDDTFLLEMRL